MSAERGDVEAIRERVSHVARGCRSESSHNPAPYLNDIDAALDRLAAALERAEREREEAWRAHELAMKAGLARGARAEKAERALANSDIRTVASDSRFSNEYLGIVVRAALRPSEDSA